LTLADARRVAEEAAAQHGVRLVRVGPVADFDGYEVRMKRRDIDWHSVLLFSPDDGLGQFMAEVFALAEQCADGPSS
jgi:hypothetical protein